MNYFNKKYYEVVELEDGTKEYYQRVKVGGMDEDGEYMILLDDGPAEGEKIYV